MTIPSSFLFELPLDELDSSAEAWMDPLADPSTAHAAADHEIDHHVDHDLDHDVDQGADHQADDSFEFGALAEQGDDAARQVAVPRPVGPAWHGKSLRTAAELLSDTGPSVIADWRGGQYVERSAAANADVAKGAASAAVNSAAELFSAPSPPPPRLSADDFFQGMVVRHPVYGLGKIVALSGGGPRRTATVAFASGVGQKKFVVGQSTLRPAKGQ